MDWHSPPKIQPTKVTPPIPGMMVNYIAGVAGGVSVVLVGHPFDTTKTRLQTAPPGYYNGVYDCVKQTLKYEGPKGFFAGIVSPLLGQMFFRAASFTTFYETVASASKICDASLTDPKILLLAGGGTGFLISFIETPIDLVKTKLQVQVFGSRLNPSFVPAFTTFRGCLKHIIKTEGVRGLYQGWTATAIRNVPANALFFPMNEMIKAKFAEMNNVPVTRVSVNKKLISGACAGLCYWTLTYPLDAIKGRSMGVEYRQRQSWLSIVKSMKFHEFFIGIVPCAVRGAIACAAMFYTFDVVRIALIERIP